MLVESECCGKLSPKELDITDSYDATLLLQLLISRKFTAREVLDAFMKRATIAQQLISIVFPHNLAKGADSGTDKLYH